MKLITGVVIGALGYAAWALSEPEEGEEGDMPARVQRLKAQWQKAVGQGKLAGDEKRVQMQQEFETIFTKPAK